MDNQIKYFFKNITGTVFAKPKHYVWQLQPSDRIYRVQIQKQHKGRNKTFNKEKIYYAFVAPDSFIDDNGYATKNIFSQNRSRNASTSQTFKSKLSRSSQIQPNPMLPFPPSRSMQAI